MLVLKKELDQYNSERNNPKCRLRSSNFEVSCLGNTYRQATLECLNRSTTYCHSIYTNWFQ